MNGISIRETLERSRLILGTARYPSPKVLCETIRAAMPAIATVSLRRSGEAGNGFWNLLKLESFQILPNTAGCRSVEEAVTTAKLARECFQTNWIKLEITGEERFLPPDPFALVEATEILNALGFEVFPYTTDDLVVAERLIGLGCQVLMPWAAPIGSGQGLSNRAGLLRLRKSFPETVMIVDAGLRAPSQAAEVMEMGFDAVMVNTAVATACSPQRMGKAFAGAVVSGRLAYEAGLMGEKDAASSSTPNWGKPFWHREREWQ